MDLGEVAEHGVKNGEFEIVNHRASKITIAEILPDCSCTSAKLAKSELAPEESTTVQVTYSSSAFAPGAVKRQLHVRIVSFGESEEMTINVVGNTTADIKLASFPKIIDFGQVPAGSIVRRTMYLRGDPAVLNSIPDQLDLQSGSSFPKLYFDFGQPTRFPTVKKIEVQLHSSAQDSPGQMNEFLRIVDSADNHSEIVTPVRAQFVSMERTIPSRLVIFVPQNATPQQAEFCVISSSNSQIVPGDFKCDAPLKVELVASAEASDRMFSVRLDESVAMVARQDISTTLKLYLRDGAKVLDIPVAVVFLN